MAGDDPEILENAPPGAMCLGCRYDISGMDIRAKCPECGDRIAPSVNNISLEHAGPDILRALEAGTRQAKQAGLIAILGLLLLCVAYTLGNRGVPTTIALFGTLLGAVLLLISTGLAILASRTVCKHRIAGEDGKLKTMRTVLPICAVAAAAIAGLSAIMFALVATRQILPHGRSFLSYYFVLWMAFPFVPIYFTFYLQMLAQRSRALSARVLAALAGAGFLGLILMPTVVTSSSHALFALFGIHVPSRFPAVGILPGDPAYVWPTALAFNIGLALAAISYFRRGLGLTNPNAHAQAETEALG